MGVFSVLALVTGGGGSGALFLAILGFAIVGAFVVQMLNLRSQKGSALASQSHSIERRLEDQRNRRGRDVEQARTLQAAAGRLVRLTERMKVAGSLLDDDDVRCSVTLIGLAAQDAVAEQAVADAVSFILSEIADPRAGDEVEALRIVRAAPTLIASGLTVHEGLAYREVLQNGGGISGLKRYYVGASF